VYLFRATITIGYNWSLYWFVSSLLYVVKNDSPVQTKRKARLSCETSGFHGGESEDDGLLENSAV
jgi:hypothetical protein